jgi:hypothetical protein
MRRTGTKKRYSRRSRKMRSGKSRKFAGAKSRRFAGSKSRKLAGGMPYGGPLSPHSFDGQGVGTSGVGLQFVAGNAA